MGESTRPKTRYLLVSRLESEPVTAPGRRLVAAYDVAFVIDSAAVGCCALRIVIFVILLGMKQCTVDDVTGIQPFIGNVTSSIQVQGVGCCCARDVNRCVSFG